MRIYVLACFTLGFLMLVVSDFTVHYPTYYSVPIGFALGGLGASAYTGHRR